MQTISYDPTIEQHPEFSPETPAVEEGDAVILLGYSGVRTVHSDSPGPLTMESEILGQERFLSESFMEQNDRPWVNTGYIVKELRGEKVRVQHGLNGSEEWIPKGRIHDVDPERTKAFEEKRQRQRASAERIRTRVLETDMDELMGVIQQHARKVCSDVWYDTIDPDEADWFWNKRLRSSAGMCYSNSRSSPKGIGGPAIGLAPNYYYLYGTDAILEVARHELIHLWQVLHPDGGKIGHGPKFHQWVDDMKTHRHCKHWSRATVSVDGDDVIVDGRVVA